MNFYYEYDEDNAMWYVTFEDQVISTEKSFQDILLNDNNFSNLDKCDLNFIIDGEEYKEVDVSNVISFQSYKEKYSK